VRRGEVLRLCAVAAPVTHPTIPELGDLVRTGRINAYEAAYRAMARMDAGLCTDCQELYEGDEDGQTCPACRGGE
jgi:hypothetical protein